MSSINHFFDKIYIINLSHSVQRKQKMIEQFKKYNITNYKFFLATDKSSINTDELKNSNNWAFPGNNFYCSDECTCNGNGHELTKSEIAINISHDRVYHDMISNNFSNCLIMEDDCFFTDEILNFDKIIQDIPKDWELVYFGNTEFISPTSTVDIQNSYFKKCFGIPCVHMYAITKNCAIKLSSNMYPLRAAIDGYIHRFIIEKNIIHNSYVCTKNLGINGSLYQIVDKENF